jgi:hypothetical protein
MMSSTGDDTWNKVSQPRLERSLKDDIKICTQLPIPERENSTDSYTVKRISSAKANTELSTTTMLHVRNEDERVASIKKHGFNNIRST